MEAQRSDEGRNAHDEPPDTCKLFRSAPASPPSHTDSADGADVRGKLSYIRTSGTSSACSDLARDLQVGLDGDDMEVGQSLKLGVMGLVSMICE